MIHAPQSANTRRPGGFAPARWLWVPLLLAISGVVMAAPPQVAKPAANACRRVDSLAKLPPAIQKQLGVGQHGLIGIADRGQSFNSSDMLDADMPSRGFNRACMSDGQVIVLLDVGGIVLHHVLKAFVKQHGAWSESRSVVVWSGPLSASDEALRQTLDDAWERWHPPPPPSS